MFKTEVGLFEAHDPYLFVANLTSGSMALAESNINTAAFGIVAFVFGAVLLIPLFLLKVLDMFDATRRRRSGRLSYSDFEDIPLQQCTISEY